MIGRLVRVRRRLVLLVRSAFVLLWRGRGIDPVRLDRQHHRHDNGGDPARSGDDEGLIEARPIVAIWELGAVLHIFLEDWAREALVENQASHCGCGRRARILEAEVAEAKQFADHGRLHAPKPAVAEANQQRTLPHHGFPAESQHGEADRDEADGGDEEPTSGHLAPQQLREHAEAEPGQGVEYRDRGHEGRLDRVHFLA
mmetsp:Transcript_102203/g.293249  ORF Transcript_102203/g.293249 Transcript_102203/m.293249 type:complete len:200 (+) Transcript_102203:162-761(+)